MANVHSSNHSGAIRNGLLPSLRTSSSDLTQSSLVNISDTTGSTPLTSSPSIYHEHDSTANSASQSRSKMFAPSVEDSLSHTPAPPRSFGTHKFNQNTVVSRTPSLSPPKSKTTIELTPGQKRTASGEMKFSVSPERLRTPTTASSQRSRAMSTDSNASRIAEISAQLRARLSYAAAKVEEDWQHNPNENGRISPRRSCSPTRTNAKLLKSNCSPAPVQTFPGQINSPGPCDSNSKTPTNPSTFRDYPVSQGHFSRNESMNVSPKGVPPTQNGPSGPYRQSTSHPLAQIPRLAPPADIIAGNGMNSRRRPNPNSISPKKAPSSNYNYNSKPLQQQQQSSNPSSAFPGTPPQQPSIQLHARGSSKAAISAKQRTPSQNALMEQDAIETLLFMSSPENSGYHPSSRPQPRSIPKFPGMTELTSTPSSVHPVSNNSTSGPHFAWPGHGPCNEKPNREQHPKRVSFADDGRKEIPNSTQYPFNTSPGLEQEAGDEIDRMLDEIDDSDAEQDYDWFAHLSGTGNRATVPQSNNSRETNRYPTTYRPAGSRPQQ